MMYKIKIPNLCANIIYFFEIADIGHHDTGAVPLYCQKNYIDDILSFGLLSDTKYDLTFRTYNSNADGSSISTAITMGVKTQIAPEIKYC